jgi:hypothetical protein
MQEDGEDGGGSERRHTGGEKRKGKGRAAGSRQKRARGDHDRVGVKSPFPGSRDGNGWKELSPTDMA